MRQTSQDFTFLAFESWRERYLKFAPIETQSSTCFRPHNISKRIPEQRRFPCARDYNDRSTASCVALIKNSTKYIKFTNSVLCHFCCRSRKAIEATKCSKQHRTLVLEIKAFLFTLSRLAYWMRRNLLLNVFTGIVLQKMTQK